MANEDLLRERLEGVGAYFRQGAREGGDSWTYYKPQSEEYPEIRTMPLGGRLGKVGEFLGKLAYAGEGPQHRIQFLDDRGEWQDVPQGWEPGLDPVTLEPIGPGVAEQMIPQRPKGSGEDEDLQALLGAIE
jgi:hypothetical protein